MTDGSTHTIRRLTMEGKSNAKLAKNGEHGYRTIGIAMLPHKLAGSGNLCPHASEDCIAGCLNVSGRTMAATIQTDIIMRARLARTLLYYQDRAKFLEMLTDEIEREREIARRDGQTLIVRPNVISDIDWARHHRDIVERFPDVIWYGYTKNPLAMQRFIDGHYPANYHLTFSRSEKADNQEHARRFLGLGYNVSVIFDTRYTSMMKRPLPAEYWGYRIIDGDETDLRFLDPRGVIVGLRAKGRLRQPSFQNHGFVVGTDRDHVAPRVID
jgi:hypothetical protein